jgi:hypothetical protein
MPSSTQRAIELECKIDANPLRVLGSCADRLKTALQMFNIAVYHLNFFTVDWLFFMLAIVLSGTAFGAERDKQPWFVIVFGIALLPYVLYMLVAAVHRNAPFFSERRHNFEMAEGTYQVVCFGKTECDSSAISKNKISNVNFYWCAGELRLREGNFQVSVPMQAAIRGGIVYKKIAFATSLADAKTGYATLFATRLPAFCLTLGNTRVIAVLRKKQKSFTENMD